MKKITALILAFIMLMSFAGCKKDSGSPESPTGANKVTADVGDNAMLVNNMTVSAAQFSYYYTSAYNYYASMEKKYRQQGISIGFDLEKAPDEVNSNQTDKDGNALTWNDVIVEYAKVSARNNFAFYAEATSAGYTLSTEDAQAIESTLDTLDRNAENMRISTNEYIDTYIAKGLDRDGVKKLLEIEAVAMAYENVFRDKVNSKITEEQVEERYNQNPVAYSRADVTCCSFPLPDAEPANGETEREFNERYNGAKKEVEASANEVAEATNYSDFVSSAESYESATLTEHDGITYINAEAVFGEKAGKWIFDSSRTAGDVEVFETETAVIVVFISKGTYTSYSTDVRHCLIAFDAQDPKNPTQSEKDETYAKAKKLLDGLEENGVTEEKFIEIVKNNSDDAASVPNGGLYENITVDAGYVKDFAAWSLAPERKAGDCEIVETEFGYHIMYFVENNGEDWRDPIRKTLESEAYEIAADELVGENGKYQITVNDAVIDNASKEFCDGIRNKKINYAY